MSVRKHNWFLLIFLLMLWTRNSTAQSAPASNNTAQASLPTPKLNVRTGLRMELVADGNLVDSPAALAFDEMGRLYVAELRDYPASTTSAPLSGRVRLLEDSDHNGRFDASTVFADDLTLPSALVCSRSGVFIAGAKGLAFALDQDNDEVADLQRTLLTFDASPSPTQPDQFPRSMIWGPDRRIHLALPVQDVEVSKLNTPNSLPLRIRQGGLAFNPLTLELQQEATAGATGIAFDTAGRRFLCSPATPLAVGMLSDSNLQRNPFSPVMPSAAGLVSSQPGRTPLDCLIYQGERYSTNLQDQAFLADPAQGAIYMVTLKDGKLHPEAITQRDQFLAPFVTSTDKSFRPINMAVGPDDLIYIADLAREAYPDGPSSDPNSESGDRKASGRIWRLVPTVAPAGVEILADLKTPRGLAGALGSSNSWVRNTAARLLLERHQTNAIPALRSVLTRAKWSVARLEALRSLEACGAVSARDLTLALADKDVTVRAAAVAMLQTRIRDGQIADPFWASLQACSVDPSPELKYQAAVVLGSVRFPSPRHLLTEIFAADSEEAWIHRAMLTSLPENLASLFIQLVGERNIRDSSEGRELLLNLAVCIGLAGRNGDISDCLRAMLDLDVNVSLAYPLIAAFSEGVQGRGSRLPQADVDGYWTRIATTALTVAVEGNEDILRADAVRVVAACIGPEFVVGEYLLLLLGPETPEPMQIPLIQALAAQGTDRDFEALTQRWHLWNPPGQLATLNCLLESEAGADALLRALADGRIPTEALTSVHIQLLRSSPQDDIRARANRMFGRAQPNRDVLLGSFLGTLDLPASSATGRSLFMARCSYCHRADQNGLAPAPESMSKESPLQLLAGLLDPSREIVPTHATTILHLRNGRTVWGVANETKGTVISLRTDAGTRPFLNSAVGRLVQTEWSLMPDNISAGFSRQEVADLVAFLKDPRHY